MKGKTDVKTVVAFLMAILIFNTPLLVWAQQAEMAEVMAEARTAAERDAENDVSGPLWFLAGCCLIVPGVVISYLYAPSPPPSRLLGKSPEYVAYYTDFYKEKAKNIQTKRAWTGCIITGAGCVAYYVVYLVFLASVIAGESW